MLSLVENISSVLAPLKARKIDTHQEEKHHRLHDTNDDSHKNNDDLNIDDDEYTEISIKALLLFLENFLETQLSSKLNHDKKSVISPWLKQNPSNDKKFIQSKKAAYAYAHAAETKTVPIKRAKLNQKYELKKIYTLIKDLRHLQDCGVKYLKIESKEALIKGIFAASDDMKSKQNL